MAATRAGAAARGEARRSLAAAAAAAAVERDGAVDGEQRERHLREHRLQRQGARGRRAAGRRTARAQACVRYQDGTRRRRAAARGAAAAAARRCRAPRRRRRRRRAPARVAAAARTRSGVRRADGADGVGGDEEERAARALHGAQPRLGEPAAAAALGPRSRGARRWRAGGAAAIATGGSAVARRSARARSACGARRAAERGADRVRSNASAREPSETSATAPRARFGASGPNAPHRRPAQRRRVEFLATATPRSAAARRSAAPRGDAARAPGATPRTRAPRRARRRAMHRRCKRRRGGAQPPKPPARHAVDGAAAVRSRSTSASAAAGGGGRQRNSPSARGRASARRAWRYDEVIGEEVVASDDEATTTSRCRVQVRVVRTARTAAAISHVGRRPRSRSRGSSSSAMWPCGRTLRPAHAAEAEERGRANAVVGVERADGVEPGEQEVVEVERDLLVVEGDAPRRRRRAAPSRGSRTLRPPGAEGGCGRGARWRRTRQIGGEIRRGGGAPSRDGRARRAASRRTREPAEPAARGRRLDRGERRRRRRADSLPAQSRGGRPCPLPPQKGGARRGSRRCTPRARPQVDRRRANRLLPQSSSGGSRTTASPPYDS